MRQNLSWPDLRERLCTLRKLRCRGLFCRLVYSLQTRLANTKYSPEVHSFDLVLASRAKASPTNDDSLFICLADNGLARHRIQSASTVVPAVCLFFSVFFKVFSQGFLVSYRLFVFFAQCSLQFLSQGFLVYGYSSCVWQAEAHHRCQRIHADFFLPDVFLTSALPWKSTPSSNRKSRRE